jgi:cysteinyl-tRNA synthetase
VLEQWGRETILVFFLTGHWSKPIDFSDETLAAAAARVEGFREVFRGPSEPAPAGAWERFEAALEDDFNTPDALAVMHGWRDHELLLRALGIFGLAALAEEREAPSEIVELARKEAAHHAQRLAEYEAIRPHLEKQPRGAFALATLRVGEMVERGMVEFWNDIVQDPPQLESG